MVQSGTTQNPIVTTVKGRRNWFVIWTDISETKMLSKKEKKSTVDTFHYTLRVPTYTEVTLIREVWKGEGRGREDQGGGKQINK